MIEIENPTGYVAYQPSLKRVIREAQNSGAFPTLRDSIGGHADAFVTKTVWFVDYVSLLPIFFFTVTFSSFLHF